MAMGSGKNANSGNVAWARMKLGMRGKLFLLSLGVIAATVLVLNVYVSTELRTAIRDRMAADLEIRARLVVHGLASHPDRVDDQALAEEFAHQALARVTLIDKDGIVLGDSEVPRSELGRVENHAHRPEVLEAIERGKGIATRSSATIQHDLLYTALRADGVARIAVVRLAESLEPVDAAAGRARELMAWGTLLAVVFAAAISSIGSSMLTRSIRDLRDAARAIVADPSVRTRLRGDDEVGSVGQTLDRLAEDLKTSLARIEHERDQLEAILETMVEGVLVTGPDGRIVMTNRALCGMVGTSGLVVGRPPLEAIRNADLSELLSEVASTRGVRTAELEFSGITPRRLRVSAAPLSGAPEPGVVAVFTDLTELRRLESIRRDFVANVSHELRTPIAAVMAAAETLENGALDDAASARPFVEIIGRHSQRLKDLVEDLLALSHIESQKLELVPEPIDVEEALSHVVELHAAAAARHETKIELTPPSKGISIVADRRALEQVLSNLVDNAVKYAPGATVRLAVGLEGGDVAFSVQDTGPGIGPQHLSRLFERFYRVDKGRSREVGGTGLGLSIVKHVTEAMGGHVSVSSTVGKGSTFKVCLPKSGPSEEPRVG
jgi:two-component system, OmpR family, phosphate regulon sensor histidine kinase PhoR